MKTGVTLKDTNDEFTESCHSQLRKHEETPGQKVVKKLGTPVHAKMSKNSLSMFNAKNAGHKTKKEIFTQDFITIARWDISVSLVDWPGVDENSRAMS